jgi:hypothetical protein
LGTNVPGKSLSAGCYGMEKDSYRVDESDENRSILKKF